MVTRIAALSEDPRAGFGALAALWNLSWDGAGDGCQFVRQHGLRCFTSEGDLHSLLSLNHPALLELHPAAGVMRHVPLIGTEQGQLVLSLNGTAAATAPEELASLWRGKALLLWKPPPGYSGSMELGKRGSAVRWLRQALGVATKAGQDEKFDAALLARVSAFQRQRGIPADGSAGPMTLISLNAGSTDGPRLGKAPVSPQN